MAKLLIVICIVFIATLSLAEEITLTTIMPSQQTGSVPAGTVLPYAGSVVPDGWLLADGSDVSRDTYADLFEAIETTYGSGSGTTFTLPDLRGRTVIGTGQGAGLTSRTLTEVGGEEAHQLSEDEMPRHRHGANGRTRAYGEGNVWAEQAGVEHWTSYAGGDQPHNNMQPYIALNYIIKT